MNGFALSRTSLMAALLALGGCAVGPNYRRPAPNAPPAFKESSDWKLTQPSDLLVRGEWWKLYADPLLDELEAKVEVSNNSLRSAEARYRQAQAAASEAWAAYFPTLNADGSAGRSKSVARASSFAPGLSNNFSAGLAASWELDLWGKLRRSRESALESAQASAADLESARLSLHATLAQTYFSLRTIDSERLVMNRLVEGYQRFLQVTQNRYKQGVAARVDVVAAEAQLKGAQAQTIDLEVTRSQLEHAIAVLLGQAPSAFSLPVAGLTATLPDVPLVLPSQLLERRPDVSAAERRLAAANAQIGLAISGYFPTLSLSGSAGYQSTQYQNLFSAPNQVWSLGSSLVLPLIDAGKVRNQVASARAGYDDVLATYRQTVLGAFQEVEDNLAAARILAQESTVEEEAVTAARQTLDLTMNQYQAGTVSYLNVITAQATQLNAERSSIELTGRRFATSVTLYKAVGAWPAATEPKKASAKRP